MKNGKLALGIVSMVLGLAGSAWAFSTGGSFVPAGPGDVSFITHSNGWVYNSDTVNYHSVEASFNLIATNPGALSFTVYGRGNGLFQSCTIEVDSVNSLVLNTYSGNSSVNGFFSYVISVPAQGVGTFTYNVNCSLPPINGGLGSAIIGVKN